VIWSCDDGLLNVHRATPTATTTQFTAQARQTSQCHRIQPTIKPTTAGVNGKHNKLTGSSYKMTD